MTTKAKIEPRIKELAMSRRTLAAMNKIVEAIDGLPNKYARRAMDAAAICADIPAPRKAGK